LPSVTSIATSVAVNAFELEPISNSVFSLTGVRLWTSSTPKPLAYITESLRMIAILRPGIFHVWIAFAT